MRLSSPISPSDLAPTLWPWVKRLASTLMAGLFMVTSLLAWAPPAQAQAGLASFQPLTLLNVTPQAATPSSAPNTPYANPCDNDAVAGSFGTLAGCTGATVNLTFGDGNNRVLQSFNTAMLSNISRVQGLNEQVRIRRNPAISINGSTNITRDVLFYELGTITDANAVDTAPPPTVITLRPSQATDIEATLLSPVVNRGIDNVFHNELGPVGDNIRQDTRSNIERIDYILPGGVVVPPDLRGQEGFLVLERNGNDRFGIAAITSLNNGVPASYGPLRSVAATTTNWGNINDVQLSSVVFRREQAGADLRPSHTVSNQSVRGIFFPISSLLSTLPADAPVFGYSLVAGDVGTSTNLVNFTTFPPATNGQSDQGGLDLVAGGFGLFRIPRPSIAGNLFLNKRITRITAAGTTTSFTNTEADNTANNVGFPALVAAGLGQGAINIANPELQPGDEVEYTLYINNTGELAVDNVQICDQIPPGTTFVPDAFGAGLGVQAIPPSNALNTPPFNYPTVTYTSAADADPATFLPSGSALPAICGADRGNGALVVNVGTVRANQVGVIRFRTQVNPFLP
ncbi:DUF11 domain-containing protein [Phormidium sp. FACHB-1136]|uniref:DUF11 domain-containing protein n=1 Tax=Phormidium sp. FACHB-1136 TaxID=2692848 RepID=UPI00168331C2|nr:DUF11 domain-containing protein [Phormidium sp. FACHB-1136]MBD2425743.1 DUF11 domain-containing protein [Phormidium sp. FACHB-1136]